MSEIKKRRALVIEDGEYFGRWICAFLLGLGFEVIWITKILEIHKHGVLCLCLHPTNDSTTENPVFVAWGDNIVVALVDALLGITALTGLHGWHVLSSLGEHCVPRIVISANESDNRIMTRDYGAEFATHHKILNPDVFRSDVREFLTQLGLL